MTLLIDGGRIPPRWAEKKGLLSIRPTSRYESGAESLKIALINNMPDAALEDTEMQFMDLLEASAGDVPVELKLYSLAGVRRSDRGQQHLNNFYFGVNDLLNSGCDGLIMTGTEPRQADLRQEPYWSAMTDVLDWAEHNTASTILSCLAAHAGVLHSDGIPRHRLPDKKFGVFESLKTCGHDLTRRTTSPLRFPHSRWNEVREADLIACGYTALTKSPEAGVDVFAKQKKKSLFLHFQGHPEYGAHTLLKEYRRDVKRFLRKERETYPTMPYGYFDANTMTTLTEFQQKAVATPREEQMAFFPETVVENLCNTWQSSAHRVYRNWLQYLVAKRAEASFFVAMTASFEQILRKRSAVSR
jgi:homoserine O-succinyltransferase